MLSDYYFGNGLQITITNNDSRCGKKGIALPFELGMLRAFAACFFTFHFVTAAISFDAICN